MKVKHACPTLWKHRIILAYLLGRMKHISMIEHVEYRATKDEQGDWWNFWVRLDIQSLSLVPLSLSLVLSISVASRTQYSPSRLSALVYYLKMRTTRRARMSHRFTRLNPFSRLLYIYNCAFSRILERELCFQKNVCRHEGEPRNDPCRARE